MKEIIIECPKGYEIDKKLSTFEKIVFKKVDNRFPDSWEDLNSIKGYFIDDICEITPFEATLQNVHNASELRNLYPTKELAEAALALCQLLQLRNHVWGDWKPDWNNEYFKYCIKVISEDLDINAFSVINSILSFKTHEDAKIFLNKYRDLIEIAKPLI